MLIISIILLVLFLLFLMCVLGYLIYTSFIQPGAVFYPSKEDIVKKMLKLSGATKRDVVMDLGSGDGRILIEAGKLGIKSIGYEIDPVLVIESRKKIQKAGVENLAEVKLKSFWLADFNKATIITLYLFPKYMDRLQTILEKKLTHPILIVSNDYEFPRKKYFKKQGKIYLYKFP